ncbi:MAG: TonB-dependent siderophore receptor [Nitrospira sp.]|nr:MAG: TonB-dependent siderophore receptor [Nitrospira sp.]
MNVSLTTHACPQRKSSRIISRGLSIALGAFLMTIALTACIGPIKPVPTQQSQEVPPPPTETAKTTEAVEPTPPEASPSPTVTPPVPIPPIGSGQPIEPQEKGEVPVVEAKPVLVVAQRESYRVPNATSGTKTNTPIMETPLNVQVISQQVLKDQQVIQIDQALKNVSGVTTHTGTFNDVTLFLRGFETGTLFRNGFRMEGTGGPIGLQFANVERIEVLKGPAAILYGRVEPGGMVNIITKQPLATPYYSLTQQFGSYNLYRTSIDATGPLTKDETLLYRFNMSYQNSGSFRDLVTGEDVFLAPIVTWNISPRTQATLEMNYLHKLSSLDIQFLPLVNNHLVDLPHSRNLLERNRLKSEHIFVGFNWSHQFNDDWSIKHQVSFKRQDDNTDGYAFPLNIDLVSRTVDRLLARGNFRNDTVATNLDLTGHVKTWGLEHVLLFGGDYYRWNSSGDQANSNDLSTISLDHPIHPGTPAGIDESTRTIGKSYTDNYGLYLQDQITLPYNVHVMGGLRYQNVHTTSKSAGAEGVFTPGDPQTDQAVTPRVGLLWQPKNWLSLYSNYAENFGANNGRGFGGKPLPPQSAQQWEVGAKTQFFDGRLRATLAYYNLTKTNVATPDPAHLFDCGGGPCSLAVGEVRSKGPELDIQGEILPGWNVIATYANQDVRVTKDNTIPVGNRLQFVPRNVGSVWTTYEVQQGDLKGFKLGGGVNGQDGVVDNDNTIKSSGYVLVGLMTGYSYYVGTSKVTAQLNVDNLLDQTYSTNAFSLGFGNIGFVNFATPRTFLGSIRIEY